MENLQTIELVAPLWQVALFVGLNTLFMLFHRVRLSLITSYLFSFYWGLIYNEKTIYTILDGSPFIPLVYLTCGLAFLVLVITAWSVTD